MSAALKTAARGWLGDEDKATLVPPSATLDENPVTAGSKRAACRRPMSRGGVENGMESFLIAGGTRPSRIQ